jgi:predicted RNA-binding Zn-ribbon protein involved in translation (DUF1610 family)
VVEVGQLVRLVVHTWPDEPSAMTELSTTGPTTTTFRCPRSGAAVVRCRD